MAYPELSNIATEAPTIADLLAYPNAVYPYFWAWILFVIWGVIALTTYFKEKEEKGFGRMLESGAVASMVVIVLAVLGTIAQFIEIQIMVFVLVLGFLLIGVWFYTSRS